ncbi:restriction endonuclease subunit S [Hominicoprocola fusiformis]
MAKLGEVFTIASGGTPDKKKPFYYENGTIPWVKTGDLKTQYVPEGIECITEEGLDNSSAKLFPPNTVLVAMYGATIGACSILPYEAATNQACAAFLPNENVLPTYLYYFLSSKREQFVKDGVGGAQPNISAGYLKNVQFGLIPMQQQIDIVEKLDKVEKLIALRKEQLAKLDQLVKSRFVEMFGDLAAPDCKWDSEKLVYACVNPDDIKCGPFGTQLGKEEYVNEGVAVWEIPQINSLFSTAPTHYLTEEKAKQLEAYSIKPGDIAMSRKGNAGKCAVFPSNFESGVIHSDVLRIRVDSDRVLPLFMMYQLHYSGAVQHQIELVSSGAIMAGINVTKLKQIFVHIPPLELQNKFVSFVEQVDKSKLTIQQSLYKLELLKKSLMQQYFG